MSDNQRVKDFLQGDDIALEKLIEKYLKPIYNFIYQLTRDKAVAQDITQDVFVRVWKNIDSFDTSKKFSTWLYAIAKNASLDWLKKKRPLPFSAFKDEDSTGILENIEDDTILYAENLLQSMDNKREAEIYLDSLSLQHKTIILLHIQQGFSLVEIAEIMKSPVNTVKSKYRRAIIFLKKISLSTSSHDANDDIAPETFIAS
jgi:RNA polymerase sigma-70 factor (ECF subfamily)